MHIRRRHPEKAAAVTLKRLQPLSLLNGRLEPHGSRKTIHVLCIRQPRFTKTSSIYVSMDVQDVVPIT